MAYVDWRINGPQFTTCNCQVGCPCQFNGLPTHGDCRAAVAMRIDQGHFGDVPLDGLHWVSLVAWPGAIHEGDGQCLAVIDERADEPQRSALLTILAGDETAPGATIFNVFASTFTTVHPPEFRPIVFSADIAAGRPLRGPRPDRSQHRADSEPDHQRAASGAGGHAGWLRIPRGRVCPGQRQGRRAGGARLDQRPCPPLHDAPDAAWTGRVERRR
jgi:hypothetical protein